jgi:hypothetical protein
MTNAWHEKARQSASREQLLELVLSDPPTVHIELGNPEGGVWRTDRDCYELLLRSCTPGMRTLETGMGISTALFLLSGARHTCVTPFTSETDRFVAYCNERAISLADFNLLRGYSHEVLPALQGELDVVFIDGGHAFPVPITDWCYAGLRLRRGGLLVIDDLQTPAVGVLTRYLDCDPRWQSRARTPKWAAYERHGEGPLREEWTEQLFYKP